MSHAPNPPRPGLTHPGVRNYLFVCLCGLLVILMGLFARGHGSWSLVPVLVGLGTLVVRWQVGPLLTLGVLGVVLEPRPWALCVRLCVGPTDFDDIDVSGLRTFLIPELVVCAGALSYVSAHYRMQGLLGDIFPRERTVPPPLRPGQRGPAPLRGRPRGAALATPGEMLMLLAALPLWVGLALVAYPLLVPGALGRRGPEWYDADGPEMLLQVLLRFRFLVLLTGVAVLSLWGLHGYLSWRRWSPDEARLALQDVVWSQTSGEDRRINAWRMWAWWRRKGNP